jgi:hypothetical protein
MQLIVHNIRTCLAHSGHSATALDNSVVDLLIGLLQAKIAQFRTPALRLLMRFTKGAETDVRFDAL